MTTTAVDLMSMDGRVQRLRDSGSAQVYKDLLQLADFHIPAAEQARDIRKADIQTAEEKLKLYEDELAIRAEGGNAETRKGNLAALKRKDVEYLALEVEVRKARAMLSEAEAEVGRLHRMFTALRLRCEYLTSVNYFLAGAKEEKNHATAS
jgi:hypothetical protein